MIDEVKKIDEEYNYFNSIVDSPKKEGNGKLDNVAVSVKDCICVKGVESRAGSKILSGYRPVFDSTVISKVKQEGGMIIGKTSQDAFGFGSFNTNVGLGMKIPLNPFDKERVCGGSSGGSAGITQKASFRHISLAESTGGSIVCPASFCGVVGLCPTYGRVSRYGLMDYANSLDKIGPMAKNVSDVGLMMEVISGSDDKESTSLDAPVPKYSSLKKGDLKIGVIKESLGKGTDDDIKKIILDKLDKAGCDEVSLPLTNKYGVYTYYLIAMCEASTNLARYCGMRYGKHENLEGNFNKYFSKVRSNNLNEESKRRVIIGTFARMAGFRDAYYIKAMQLRTKIIEEYKKLFSKYDVLVSPTMPIVAPRFDDVKKLTPLQNYMMDILTVGPNLAGLPHMTVPAGFKDKMPVGMMIIGDHLNEEKVMQAGSGFE